MLSELAEGRLLGHPIHPMLIHFPTALFAAAYLFEVVAVLWLYPGMMITAFYCIGLGLAVGIIAAIFGLVDLLKLTKREHVFKKAAWHGLIQFTVIMVYGTFFGIYLKSYPEIGPPGWPDLLILGPTVLLMLVGNYLGGDLVFRHGVGVKTESDRLMDH